MIILAGFPVVWISSGICDLEWVDWFVNPPLLEPIGNIPPAQAEERCYAMLDGTRMAT